MGFTSDDYNVVQGLVAAGVAISLLPELALSNLRDDIVIKPIGKRTPHRRVLAATLAGGFRSPAMNAMLDVLGEVAEGYTARAPVLAAVS
jgi:DNA-binding transcriptional LysR family regulator